MTGAAKELVKVLKDLGILKEDTELVIRRTYASRNQKSGGSWIWWAEGLDRTEVCGSCDRLTSVIKAHKLDTHYIEIYRHIGGCELSVEDIRIKGKNEHYIGGDF